MEWPALRSLEANFHGLLVAFFAVGFVAQLVDYALACLRCQRAKANVLFKVNHLAQKAIDMNQCPMPDLMIVIKNIRRGLWPTENPNDYSAKAT